MHPQWEVARNSDAVYGFHQTQCKLTLHGGEETLNSCAFMGQMLLDRSCIIKLVFAKMQISESQGDTMHQIYDFKVLAEVWVLTTD